MQLKSPDSLMQEYRKLVADRAALALSHVKGAIWGLETQEEITGTPAPADIKWILAAHKGTLEKLHVLLPDERQPSSLELLSAARNLFENNIWLKLFDRDRAWGVHFYGRLLKDQFDDLTGLIAKIEAEAEMFRKFEEEDDELTDEWIRHLGDDESTMLERSTEAKARHDAKTAELDDRARRTFSLYAAQAKFNGYGYQVHLLESKELPRCRDRLSQIETRLAEFKAEVADEALAKRYMAPFKWKEAADAVGMGAQYEYLYRLTSRLLHSGPMNIITEKELIESERTVLLEYMVVGAADALDVIESFDFPGRANLAFVEVDG